MNRIKIYIYFIKSTYRQFKSVATVLLLSFCVILSILLLDAAINAETFIRNIISSEYNLQLIRIISKSDNSIINSKDIEIINDTDKVSKVDPYFSFLSLLEYKDENIRSILIGMNPNSQELSDLTISYGRNISSNDIGTIVITERTLRAMGITDPSKVINKSLIVTLRRPVSNPVNNTYVTPSEPNIIKTPVIIEPTSIQDNDINIPSQNSYPITPSLGITTIPQRNSLIDVTAPISDYIILSTDDEISYQLLIVGVAARAPSDRTYIPMTLALEIAAWEVHDTSLSIVNNRGYTGIQAMVSGIENVSEVQKRLSSLGFIAVSALDKEQDAQKIVLSIKNILFNGCLLVIFISILLTFFTIKSTINSSKKKIGTIIMLGANRIDVFVIILIISFCLSIPSSLIGISIYILVNNYIYYQIFNVYKDVIYSKIDIFLYIGASIPIIIGLLVSIIIFYSIKRYQVSDLIFTREQ
ncbi:FtsX-like permease family protein [Herpetosiphon geysericola]|uniref:ABC3 transporter permease C-terminal domain-containing protein n=1 Tax=Herpetosiphon geysericola TaxID=70996 RepID=A0A0P6YEH5_9CHLR|nr:FtsX-like permease family protein [Herpetosiphon geysericola]KPL80478.1 hypothetical protein SE18_23890 [Herpetosiphon geysericola]